MRKKICLVTWHTSLNYGTCIQAYALASYLRKIGFDVYIPESFRFYYGLKHPMETAYTLILKIKTRLNKKKVPIDIEREYNVRYKKNYMFSKEMSGVKHFSSKAEFLQFIKETDFFISGSDQIWNPWYVTPPMLLSFASKDKIKIAYGSSIGVSNIPKNKLSLYKKYLSEFKQIGVRENTAKKTLSKFIDNSKVQVVLDPTFLLLKSDWEQIAQKPEGLIGRSEFVFCYFIGNNYQWISDINTYKKNNSMDIVVMTSESMFVPKQFNCILNGGVKEFIWCILNAKFVLTDSFHATALSINFGQPFVVYKRFLDNNSQSQNSRIYDMLNKFDLGKCLKDNDDELSLYFYDKCKVLSILDSEREKCFSFLLSNLSNES